MNKSVELMCAHSILVCSFFLGLGLFGIVGWMPPLHADMDAQAVAAMFEQDRFRIQLGLTVFGFRAMFYWFELPPKFRSPREGV